MKTEQYNGVSFENQTFYVGIDVHKKNWSVSIRTSGMNVKNFVLSPGCPEGLKDFLERHYNGGRYIAVYEAGFCGFWIQRKLCDLGIECMVVNPADIPSTHKERVSKDDRNDSRKLALRLEKKDLNRIYIPSVEAQGVRSLCRYRTSISKDVTRVKNRIKSFLYFYGYDVGDVKSNWSGEYLKRLKELSKSVAGGETLDMLVDQLKSLNNDLKRCERKIKEALKEEKNKETEEMVNLLMSVPGIGFISAVTLAGEIIDINRFRNFNHFASFAGLIPSTFNSGDKEKSRGKTRRCNPWVNRILIENAWVAVRIDPALLKRYAELCRRLRPQKSIIRIAKKLLRRIYHVLKTKTPYKKGIL